MYVIFFVLAGCGEGRSTPYFPGSYDTEVRADLPAPADEGGAPYEGSLGPPRNMVEPVITGGATTTREGSGGPPMLAPGEARQEPLPYQVRGPDPDAQRTTSGPPAGLD